MAEAQVAETWQCNRTVLERNQYMLENQLATDVTFLVGESPGRRIPAHRYVLISGSPVFYSMFCGVMRERGEVKVPDIEPDIFTQMLRYLYYEEADITGDSVMEIIYTSKKYLVPGLTKMCTDFLENNLSGENAAAILEECLMFDEKEMVAKCMKVIGVETQKVLKSESFSKVSNDTLVKILESDTSSVTEVQLFQGCVDWARCKISKKTASDDMVRNTLGRALFNLRFPVMTIEEFADVVVPTEVLNIDEEISCNRWITCDPRRRYTPMPFQTCPRVDDSCGYIHLINYNNQGSLCSKLAYGLEFTIENLSSNDLDLKGFVPLERISEFRECGELDCFYSDITFETHSAGTCSHNKKETCITFHPITIPAGTTHTIQMYSITGIGSMSYNGEDGGLTFSSPRHNISVVVTGEIHIKEILIAKSKS